MENEITYMPLIIITSWNGNIFCATVLFERVTWSFSVFFHLHLINDWANNRNACDLRHEIFRAFPVKFSSGECHNLRPRWVKSTFVQVMAGCFLQVTSHNRTGFVLPYGVTKLQCIKVDVNDLWDVAVTLNSYRNRSHCSCASHQQIG